MRRLTYITLLLIAAVALSVTTRATAQSKTTVTVVTPYMAQPGTQFAVEALQAYGKEKGWTVNVIDTAGDENAVVSRLEDVANQGSSATLADPPSEGQVSCRATRACRHALPSAQKTGISKASKK